MANKAQIERLKKSYRRQTGQDIRRGVLGDADGVIYESSRPGYVRARINEHEGYSPYIVVRMRTTVDPKPGTAVLIGYDEDGEQAVINTDFTGLVQQGRNPVFANSADSELNKYIKQDRIATFVSHPTVPPSLSIVVRPWIRIEDGSVEHFAGEAVDVTSDIPGTSDKHCAAGLFLKSDNTIEVICSTAKAASVPIDIADIQECVTGASSGSMPGFVWRLYNGQTEVDDDDFVMDLRQFLTYDASAVVGTHTHPTSDIASGTLAHERGGLEADVSAYDGLAVISAGATSELKCNFAGTTAPTANEDSGDGYGVGSLWCDTTNDAIYQCIDATVAAAVWKNISAGTAGSGTDSLTTGSALTIASGAITITDAYHTVSGQGGASDDLITINGGSSAGEILALRGPTSHGVTLKQGGNIRFPCDGISNVYGKFEAITNRTVFLIFDGTYWTFIGALHAMYIGGISMAGLRATYSYNQGHLIVGISDTIAKSLAPGNVGQSLVTDDTGNDLEWGYPHLKTSTANVSNPPTDAELDTEFGTPSTVGAGFNAILDDNGGGTDVYLVASDGTNWWYTAMTKAT